MRLAFPLLLTLLLVLVPTAVAQGDLVSYENEDLGIAFELPATWTSQQANNRLTFGIATDLELVANGQVPQNLIVSVIVGSYSDLQLDSPSQVPDRVQQLVPSDISAPAPYQVSYGGTSGYETEFVIEESTLVTRVVIMTATDGRIALVRGIGPQGTWDSISGPLLTEILQSMRFTLPQSMASPLDNINDNDGGVLWHYQIAQGRDMAAIELGGITYDSENVGYVAAGARGFLAIRRDTGEFINFLGPIFGNDDFTDVSISPEGNLYFSNATVSAGRRVMIVDRVGNYINAWGIAGDEPGQFAPNMPQTIAVTAFGNVWTVSEGHSTPPENRIYRFDGNGNFADMIDMADLDPDMRNARLDVNLAEDRIYAVSETTGIYVFSWNAEVLARNLSRDFLVDAVPTDISVAPNGNLIIATANLGFVEMNAQGILRDRFGYVFDDSRGGRFFPGEYLQANGIATATDGTVLFAETNPDTGFAQVQAFRFDGAGLVSIPQRTPPITENTDFSPEMRNGGPIEYDTVVRGMLDSDSPRHDYTFAGRAGDDITITLRSINPEGSLDTWLFLFDSNFNTLSENDDVGTSTETLTARDSVIRYTIGVTGNYTVRAARFGGEGVYELVIARN